MAITLCVALGLVIGAAPPPEEQDPWDFGYIPQFNWHFALLAAGSAGIVMGVLHDAWAILRFCSPLGASDNDQFARRWAILWRMLVAAAIVSSLTLKILISRQFWSPPESDMFFYDDVLTGYVWWFGLLIALGSAVNYSHSGLARPRRAWIEMLVWVGAATLIISMAVDLSMIPFLVHLACAGVDASLTHVGGRYGLHTVADQTHFAMLAALALGALIGACSLLGCLAMKPTLPKRVKRGVIIGALLLLAAAASYSAWFYRVGRPMASPDLGFGILSSSWFLQVGGIVLALMAVTVGAHRITIAGRVRQPAEVIVPRGEFASLAAATIFFILAVIIHIAETIYALLSWGGGFEFGGILEAIGYHMYQPTTFIMLALLAFSLRGLWIYWKRAASTDIQIHEIDP